MSKKRIKLEEILKDGIKVTKNAISHAKTKATIGTKKVSIYMAKNQLKEKLAELGAVVFRLLEEENKTVSKENKSVSLLCKNITEKKQQIQDIQENIQELKSNTTPQ